MKKIVDSVVENNIVTMKKVMKAGFILDLALWKKRHSEDTSQFSGEINMKKSQSMDYRNHMIGRIRYFQTYTDYVRRKDSYGYDSVTKTGVRESYMTFPICELCVKFFLDKKLTFGVGPTSLAKIGGQATALPSEEDVAWARSVLDSCGIDYSKHAVGSTKFTIKYTRLIPMQINETVYCDSIEEAREIQSKVISGEISYRAPFNSYHIVNEILTNGHNGTDLTPGEVTLA